MDKKYLCCEELILHKNYRRAFDSRGKREDEELFTRFKNINISIAIKKIRRLYLSGMYCIARLADMVKVNNEIQNFRTLLYFQRTHLPSSFSLLFQLEVFSEFTIDFREDWTHPTIITLLFSCIHYFIRLICPFLFGTFQFTSFHTSLFESMRLKIRCPMSVHSIQQTFFETSWENFKPRGVKLKSHTPKEKMEILRAKYINI